MSASASAPTHRTVAAIITTVAVGATLVLFWQRRRRKASRVLAVYKSHITDRPWYREITVCETAIGLHEVERSLHLGNAATIPESIVSFKRGGFGRSWEPDAAALIKPHLQFTLLAFAWLDRGFNLVEGAHAALIGVAGGSLVQFWRACVPGGRTELTVDAVELDGAVLRAARDHLGLALLEVPETSGGKVHLHEADGKAFLQQAEDELYDLLVVDLDMGALVGQSSSGGGGAEEEEEEGAEKEKKKTSKRRPLQEDDPTRDMYRCLTSRGVLVINEYSEEPTSKRLESTLRLVRLLRRFFPEVHQIRTNTDHNTMLIAPADPGRCGGPCRSREELLQRAAKAGRSLGGLAGIDIERLLRELPANRHQVYY